jgi:hypothetical protein
MAELEENLRGEVVRLSLEEVLGIIREMLLAILGHPVELALPDEKAVRRLVELQEGLFDAEDALVDVN